MIRQTCAPKGTHARAAVAVALAFAGLAGAGESRAQAVCSAPHSSPTLTRAGVGTLSPATGWIQATAYYSRSSEFYGADGHTRAFLANGVASTSSVFITAAAGVTHGIELWLQVPVHRLRYDDDAGDRTRIGFGDPRISARFGGALFGARDVPLSIRAGVKLPGSDFPVDPNLLPLTEGQTDVEVALEAGRVLERIPIHIAGFIGYRWRFADEERERKPGNERFARIGVGGPIRALRWELALEGLTGDDLEQQNLRLPTARRRLLQLLPTLGWSIGPGQFELTGRLNLTGRNLPSGSAVSAGVLLPFGL